MTRYCRQCKDALPPSRYFKCLKCQPNLPSDDGNFIYQGVDSVEKYDTIEFIEHDIPEGDTSENSES